jgi:hypothetical protein
VAKAQELAGDRLVEVAAGDAGGQVLAGGLVDEVRTDVIPDRSAVRWQALNAALHTDHHPATCCSARTGEEACVEQGSLRI